MAPVLLLLAALLPACAADVSVGIRADAAVRAGSGGVAESFSGMAGTPADVPWVRTPREDEPETTPAPLPEADGGPNSGLRDAGTAPELPVELDPPPCPDADTDGVCDEDDPDACPLGDADADADGWADACDAVLWEQSVMIASANLTAGAAGRLRVARADGIYEVEAPITSAWTSPTDATAVINAMMSRYQGQPSESRVQVVSGGVGYGDATGYTEIPAMGDNVAMRLVVTGYARAGSASATWQLRGYDPTPL